MVPPAAIVPQQDILARSLAGNIQQQKIQVTVTVKIGHRDRSGLGARSVHAHLLADVLEGAVAVVVEQLCRPTPLDQQQVQVGVVVQIQANAVDRLQVGTAGLRRPGHVLPLARLDLLPQLVGSPATEVDIDQPVVVEVSPQGGNHAGDFHEWMFRGQHETLDGLSLGAGQQQVAADGRGDEEILATVGVDVAGCQARGSRQPQTVGCRDRCRRMKHGPVGPLGRARDTRQADPDRQCLGTHQRVLVLEGHRERVFPEQAEFLHVPTRFIKLLHLPQQVPAAVVGRLEVRFQSQGFLVPRGRLGRLLLLQAPRHEVGGKRVPGILLDGLAELDHRRGNSVGVEQRNAQAIRGRCVLGIGDHDLFENRDRDGSLLGLVEHGDCQVDLGIKPSRLLLDQRGKHFPGLVVAVLLQQSHATVVLGNQLRGQPKRFDDRHARGALAGTGSWRIVGTTGQRQQQADRQHQPAVRGNPAVVHPVPPVRCRPSVIRVRIPSPVNGCCPSPAGSHGCSRYVWISLRR